MNAFIAIIFASLLARLSYQMARSPVLPTFAADLGALPEFIGIIVAASTITGVFFKLPSGALSDVLGRKRMMVLGAVFFALPPFLYPFVHDAWSLLALRFVHGFATAIFSPVASAYVASLAEPGRGARLGWFSSANDIGATAGPLIGGFVLYFTASYSLTYLAVGGLGVLTFIVVLLLPDVDRTAAREARTFAARAREFWQGITEVFKTPPIFVAAAIEAVMYLGYGAFLGFLPIYARNTGLNDAEIAVVLGAQLVLAMVAKPITGRVSDRVGRIPVIVTGLLLCAAALPLIFRSENLTAFVLVAPLLGLGVGAVTPVTNALIADLASARRFGAAMGVFGTIWDIGEAAGPIIAGFLIGALGYAATFDVLAAITAAVTVGLVALVRDPKKAAAIREQ
ncbi:MAG: MFS transporter [Gammaproteobacteria bacterium]|nr:MFS transporter [Gammaproteobacteria bacterium]